MKAELALVRKNIGDICVQSAGLRARALGG
jgi:hypothetical protein